VYREQKGTVEKEPLKMVGVRGDYWS
jgi:hypothetical protein